MVGGPPPINTGAPVAGYPPQIPPMQGGAPIPGGPPGYTGQGGYGAPPPGQGMQTAPYARPAAEVEGNSRSKAQLIVGIDFVSYLLPYHCCARMSGADRRAVGNDLFRRRFRIRDKQRGKRRHYYGMARCWILHKTKGGLDSRYSCAVHWAAHAIRYWCSPWLLTPF